MPQAPTQPSHDLSHGHCRTRELVILGTQYAGEMKKGIFAVMHYLMPKQGILSLHSGCNEGKDGDVTLFFGLSGALASVIRWVQAGCVQQSSTPYSWRAPFSCTAAAPRQLQCHPLLWPVWLGLECGGGTAWLACLAWPSAGHCWQRKTQLGIARNQVQCIAGLVSSV